MGSDFTAADQAFLLIDIVVTLAAMFVWAFWYLETSWVSLRFRSPLEIGIVGAWVRKSFLK
ncbi:MAG: hypothetical protein J0H42_23370 [Rhizobiales bacterium]|nr:hypothetical protein [Hyphomicrobiales bacterium]